MTTNLVVTFSKSLNGVKVHYRLKNTSKIYLREDLNVNTKLHEMYNESYPENVWPYEKFSEIFSTKSNFTSDTPEVTRAVLRVIDTKWIKQIMHEQDLVEYANNKIK